MSALCYETSEALFVHRLKQIKAQNKDGCTEERWCIVPVQFPLSAAENSVTAVGGRGRDVLLLNGPVKNLIEDLHSLSGASK